MENVNIPPLKFLPILKSAIWGGEKIAPLKGIVTDQKQIGESWEISGVKGNESVVANGADAGLTLTQMIEKYGAALVGQEVFDKFGTTFPLLIKIIDAAGDLSLQVHPDDELARKRHDSLGKTEMWYIVDTEPGAVICAGLKEHITPEQYVEKVADNTLMDVVAHHDSKPGDVFFLPAGRIHSIGAGNMLVEVQETSDVTYRIYDFGRVDAKTGKPRELHVDLAKDAIDYKVYPSYVTKPGVDVDGLQELVACKHFDVYRIAVDGMKVFYPTVDSFSCFTCIEGELKVSDDRGNSLEFRAGESMLVPAQASKIIVEGNGVIIDAFISDK
ncbi:MAG: class I mannose-6-phosphate isomerase [Roseburia sp.]|nr:class I mannose-6-phosphate isomerase [Roseburia sp.]